MVNPDLTPAIADIVEWSDSLTEYDQGHLVTYLRLLDAEADGATLAEMARVVLGLDVDERPEHAVSVAENHLKRARWVADEGFLDLLG